MKPNLRRNSGRKAGDEILIAALSDADRFDGVLGTIQERIGEARRKAADIEKEAKASAENLLEKARAEAAAIRAQANRDAADIKANARLSLREVQRGKSELAGLESQLKYQQRQFDAKTKQFREAVAGVFEQYFDS